MDRKLRRSRVDRMIFGVCSGLARYFDVDVTLVRVVFVLLTFTQGLGLLAYIILAIVMPEGPVAEVPPGLTGEPGSQQAPRDVEGENALELPASAQRIEPSGAHDRRATAGLVLILLGTLFFLSNLGLFWWLDWGRLWPLILIGIGLFIIWQRRR